MQKSNLSLSVCAIVFLSNTETQAQMGSIHQATYIAPAWNTSPVDATYYHPPAMMLPASPYAPKYLPVESNPIYQQAPSIATNSTAQVLPPPQVISEPAPISVAPQPVLAPQAQPICLSGG